MIAAIYARKSTEQTGVADDQKSVSRQIERAREYAAGKGWTTDETYTFVDDGISGAEFSNRPGFLRLMNALKPRPPFHVLIMSEESRLGREAIETAYALKQLVQAGVRVFFYMEDRERTLDSPTDKIMMSLTAFADELEREKARQRTYDAMSRKAKAGHVTGGRVFGYDNVEITASNGDRSHVVRRIDEDQAAIVRCIFEYYAAGAGVRTIAKRLNDEGRPGPRPQQGRPAGWAPSSVWEALHRPIYRGEIVWNQTRKRNRWGATAPVARPEAEWLRMPAPELRIVPESLCQAVEARAVGARTKYLESTGGASWGRPADARESRHLLVGFTRCGCCGASLLVNSRSHGGRRAEFYGCSAFHRRGRSVCANSLEVRVDQVDEAILDDVERFVLDPRVVKRAIALALEALRPSESRDSRQREQLERDARQVQAQIENLTRAIGAGGDIPSLVNALQTAGQQRLDIDRRRLVPSGQNVHLVSVDWERQVLDKLAQWRALLRQEVSEARQIVRQLITGRIAFTPKERGDARVYAYRGTFTIGGLFDGSVVAQLLASPTGVNHEWIAKFEGFQPARHPRVAA